MLKQKLLGSILEEKLEFSGNEYRTPSFVPGFRDIYLNYNKLRESKSATGRNKKNSSRFVLGAGLEPARPQWSQDFKSCVSTNSTIRAESFVDWLNFDLLSLVFR